LDAQKDVPHELTKKSGVKVEFCQKTGKITGFGAKKTKKI